MGQVGQLPLRVTLECHLLEYTIRVQFFLYLKRGICIFTKRPDTISFFSLFAFLHDLYTFIPRLYIF